MRFTVVGHRKVFVESEGRRLIVDPWLFGSCYWRSWWHDPPVESVDDAWLDVDYISLTHHHFDHFHYPSLGRIDKRATVFIPRFGVDFMAGELRGLSFTSIEEMDHGVTFPLSGNLEITSYQAGFDDSAAVGALEPRDLIATGCSPHLSVTLIETVEVLESDPGGHQLIDGDCHVGHGPSEHVDVERLGPIDVGHRDERHQLCGTQHGLSLSSGWSGSEPRHGGKRAVVHISVPPDAGEQDRL